MRLPDTLRTSVEAALRERGDSSARISAVSPVGGGCISPAARVETDAGERAFLKWGDAGSDAGEMFEEEARSLRALAGADALRVPAVLAAADAAAGGTPWLLLEWLEPGRAGPGTWQRLGRGLAALHRVRGGEYGWPTDNFIGSLAQPNDESGDWPTFWRDRRLDPQLRLAYDGPDGGGGGGHFGDRDRRRFDRLLDGLDELLDGAAAADGPSLVHGDLWSGNVHPLASGEPALIDPAAYHGHREVDLAMSELFGGFPPAFYDAYEEAWPLEPGYRERRRPVYQLYYLLVHVNLFGSGYVGRTLSALAAAGV